MKKHTSGEWNWHGPYLGGGYKVSALIAENRRLRERVSDLEDGVRAQFAKVDALIAENRRLREALESIRDSDSFRGGTWKGELQRIAKDELKHGSQS